MALCQAAQARPEPIPVYAEMSSINPVFLFDAALQARAEALAQGFVASLTQGAGQFCTNPGLVIARQGPALQRFITAAAGYVQQAPAQTMLTPGIFSATRPVSQPGRQPLRPNHRQWPNRSGPQPVPGTVVRDPGRSVSRRPGVAG